MLTAEKLFQLWAQMCALQSLNERFALTLTLAARFAPCKGGKCRRDHKAANALHGKSRQETRLGERSGSPTLKLFRKCNCLELQRFPQNATAIRMKRPSTELSLATGEKSSKTSAQRANCRCREAQQ